MSGAGKKTTPWAALLKNGRMYFKLFTHRDTPWHVKAILLAALLYLVVPTDLIPDWLLGFGIVDDLAVVSLLVGIALKLLGRRADNSETEGSDEKS